MLVHMFYLQSKQVQTDFEVAIETERGNKTDVCAVHSTYHKLFSKPQQAEITNIQLNPHKEHYIYLRPT